MSHDAELIANAIAALKPAPDYLKDYVFPITMAFFSALVGGYVALRISKIQELQRAARENLSTANKTFILAHECLNNLIAIKSNYAGKITWGEPLYRVLAYPTMLAKLDDVQFSATGLYFIRSIPTANKPAKEKLYWWIKHRLFRRKIDTPSSEETAHSWRNTVRISCMFDNYNQVMMYLRVRNEIDELVKGRLSQIDWQNKENLSQLPELIGQPLAAKYFGLTELIIALTDHLIKELYSFLLKFPDIAESNIELNRAGDGGKLPRYENNKPLFQQCLEPTPAPDYYELGKYLGMSEEHAKARHSFSDWE